MFSYSNGPRTVAWFVVAATSAGHSPQIFAQAGDDPHHQIDEVVVTATPLSRTVEQLAQPTTVLRGAELVQKQSTSIGETVSQEPGVSSSYFGPIASRPVIRGQFGERVRVLTNGLDSLDASALSDDHQATVDGILADRIEIIRGPATLLYGSGAAGGLVNVVDRRIVESPLDRSVSGGLAVGGDTALDKREYAALLKLGNDMFVVHLDAFRRDTEDVEIPGFAESALLRSQEIPVAGEEHASGTISNTDSRTEGAAAAVSMLTERGFVGFSVSTFDSNYGVPGTHEEPAVGTPETADAVRIDLEQSRLDLKGEYEFAGPVAGIRFRAARSDYTHTELEGAEIGTFFDTQGTDARVEFRHAKFGALEGAVGLQYKKIDFEAVGDEAFVPSSITQRLSLFLFEELALNDNLVLQGSARAEHQELDVSSAAAGYDDTAYGASLGAIWRQSDSFRVSLNLAVTERHPNATELYADGPHVAVQRFERGSITLNNEFLNKERSTNTDLTLHGDNGPLEWSLTVFRNDVDDYILISPTQQTLDDLPVFEYRQADVEFVGAEAEAQIELFDTASNHLHLRLFSDVVDAEEKSSGAALPRIPPFRFGVGLHYRWKDFEAGLNGIFADSQTEIAANETSTEDYVMLDVDVSYSFEESGMFLFARATNLLDEEARQHSSPLKDIAPLPGRSFHLGLRYEF